MPGHRERTYLLPEPFHVQIPDVVPVHPDNASHRIVKSLNQADDRALSAATGAHQGHALRRRKLHTKALENGHFWTRGVMKGHILKRD